MKRAALIFTFFVFLYGHAYAYLDPGTGSYIVQVLIASAVGGFFAIKVAWAKLKDKLLRTQKDSNDD